PPVLARHVVAAAAAAAFAKGGRPAERKNVKIELTGRARLRAAMTLEGSIGIGSAEILCQSRGKRQRRDHGGPNAGANLAHAPSPQDLARLDARAIRNRLWPRHLAARRIGQVAIGTHHAPFHAPGRARKAEILTDSVIGHGL